MRAFTCLATFLPVVLLCACSSDSHSLPADAGTDTGPEIDSGPDAPPDPPDAGTDSGRGAPVGAPCMSAAECEGPFCISPGRGYPGADCTANCDLGDPLDSCAPLGGDAICLEVGMPGMPMGACFDSCDPRAAMSECRDAYICVALGAGMGACLPRGVCGDGE